MSRLNTSRRLARVFLPAVVVLFAFISNAAHVASGGAPYLSSVGPPSLRFAPSTERGILTPTYYSLSDSLPKKPEVAAAAPGTKPNPSSTAKPATEPADAAEPTQLVPDVTLFPPSTNGTEITSSSPPATPPAAPFIPPTDANGISGAPDNTVVTPEMLLDYLKPSTPSTSGTGNAAQPAVVVPVKLGFVPPTPVTTAPSSQAVYKKE